MRGQVNSNSVAIQGEGGRKDANHNFWVAAEADLHEAEAEHRRDARLRRKEGDSIMSWKHSH